MGSTGCSGPGVTGLTLQLSSQLPSTTNPFHTPPPSSLQHNVMGLTPFVGLNNSHGCSRSKRSGQAYLGEPVQRESKCFCCPFFPQHFSPRPLKQTIPITAGDQTLVTEAAHNAEPLGCPGSSHSMCFKTWLRSILADKSKDVPRTRKKSNVNERHCFIPKKVPFRRLDCSAD